MAREERGGEGKEAIKSRDHLHHLAAQHGLPDLPRSCLGANQVIHPTCPNRQYVTQFSRSVWGGGGSRGESTA